MKTKITLAMAFGLFISLNSPAQTIYSSLLLESWTGTGWENSAQTMNSFDGDNFLSSSVTQTWLVPTTEWQNAFRINYTNNASGTVAQSVSQTWTVDPGIWEDISRTTNTYSGSNQLLSYVSEVWVGMWLNSARGTNTYDASDYLINTVVQSWDFIGSAWTNSSQIIYDNNANGTVNHSVVQTWSGTAWQNQSQSTFTYNGANRILTDLTQNWSGTAWVNNTLETYSYDGSGDLTGVVSQEWTGTAWQNDIRSLYTNDAAGNPVEIIGQTWDNSGSVWVNESRITLSYNLGVTGFERALSVFPNPATSAVTIKSNADLSGQPYWICDDMGRIIQSGDLDTSEPTIIVDDLQSGLYLLRIGTEGKTAKLIRE